MPKLATPLNDVKVKNAKPQDKPYKLSDGGGLHLLVNPDGNKYWRLAYRFDAKQKTLALGLTCECYLQIRDSQGFDGV